MFFAYEEFEPGTIFQITDWYLDSETQSLWYEVDIYAGGLIPESQEYWPAMPWILQDYVGEDATGDSLVFLDGCDICGKPDCGGHESVGDITKGFVGGVEAEQLTMPQFDKPTLSAATTLTGKVTYQWQILADRETDLWVDIRGEDQPDLTVTYGMVASLLDDDYQVALVGSKSPKYLWILSRTPEVSDSVLDQVLEEASGRGYDIDKLIWVDQSENIGYF